MKESDKASLQSKALYSKDGKQWHSADGKKVPINWQKDEAVTRLTIGSLDGGRIEADIPESLHSLYPNLTHLHLWGVANKTALPHLPIKLICLDLRNCPDLQELAQLPATMETLVLNLDSLEYDCVNQALPELIDLDIQGTQGIDEKSIHNLLGTCRRLRHFDASRCSQLTTITEWPGKLQTIVLNRCKELVTLPGSWPTTLRRLELSGASSVRRLPDFADTLDYIDLSYTHSLEQLPEKRGQPRTLFLYDSGLLVPPASEHGDSKSRNVAVSTAAYFADCELVGSGQVKRAKLQVLGNGDAGKTCLSLCLTDRDTNLAKKQGSTHGVQFWSWQCDAVYDGFSDKVDVQL